MKTLKLLFLICLLACLSIGISNAQGPKTTLIETNYPIDEYYLPCFDENVSGVIYYYQMWVNNKWQNKAIGELIGEKTGNVYTVMQIQNENWNGYWGVPGHLEYTFNINLQFHLNGKLVFIIHEIYHATANQNDEWVVVLDKRWNDCK